MPYTPPTITFLLESAGFAQGDPSLFDLKVTASTWSVYSAFPTWVDGWCVAEESTIPVPATYTAKVYSSYELDLVRADPNFANVGNDPLVPLVTTVPYDSSHPADPYLANLDIINWLMGHITVDTIDPTYTDTLADSTTLTVHSVSGLHYYNVAGLSGHYTYGDIEQSIFQLLGDGESTGNPFIGSYNMVDVKAIVDDAVPHDGYVPDAGDKIAVLLDLGANRQPILIETQAAALGDYVWHDLNANGIQDEVGTGIAGATVNLVRDLNSDGIITANEILATTTTDANGYYEFKGLTPGLPYQVQFVTPAGYDAVSPRQSDLSSTSGVNSDGLLSNVVTL